MNYLLDDNHDIIIGKRIARVSGAKYVMQTVKCRLLTFFGEWVLDRSIGVPWDAILVKGYSLDVVYHSVRRTIETTKGVREVLSLSMAEDKKARKLVISFEARTIYGTISEEFKF